MTWIAVGLKDDVPPGVVIPSRIDETDLAIWCTPSGIYHAWSDRCPHRGMRLSHGFVRGNTLACIYHGWQYDESGACAYIPAHPKLEPPATICVPRFDCRESGGVIWAALATPSGDPPDIAGRQPVRSITVDRNAAQIADHFGAKGNTLVEVSSDYDVTLALQPCGERVCAVHALAAPQHTRKDVSRWLEKIRSAIEGVAA